MSTVSKKAVSVLLTLCIILTMMSASLTVFAADEALGVKAIEEKILAFEGNVAVAELENEVKTAYEELISDYAALTMEEKESMNILVFDKLFKMVIDHERTVYKTENPKSAMKDQYIYGNQVADDSLTPPAYIANARALAAFLNDKTKSFDEKLAAFLAADYNTRLYVGAWYSGYGMYYALEKYPSKSLELLIADYTTAALKADPYSVPKPSRLSKPNAKNYAGGAEDPQYIADLATYNDAEQNYFIWYADSKNHEVAKDNEAIDIIVAAAPEYENYFAVAKELREAIKAFDADRTQKDLVFEALASYGTLSEMEVLMTQSYSRYMHYAALLRSGSWTYTYFNYKSLYNSCLDISNEEYLLSFIDLVNAKTEPYTREVINEVKEAYQKVPSSMTTLIPAETLQKYKAILASIAPDIPSTEIPVIENKPFTKVDYDYTGGANGAIRSYESLTSLLISIFDFDMEKLLKEGLYTNKTVGSIAKFLYPALANLSSLVAAGPADLAEALTEEKFAGAKEAALAAISEYNDKGAAVKNIEDWKNISFKNGDWGFEDGDREGFTDAVSALFRPLSILTMAINFENNMSTTGGTYTYGAYEELIPIFEALEARGYMTSVEYTEYVNAESTYLLKMDRRIRPIVVPVLNLLDDLAKDPVNNILDLLPKFGMLLNEGILNDRITTILSNMKFVTIDPLPDLTAYGFGGVLESILNGIEIEPAFTDEEGNVIKEAYKLNLKIDKDRFAAFAADLAGCGTYVVKDSKARESIYRVGIESDKAAAYVTFSRWLKDEMAEDQNIVSISSAARKLVKDPFKQVAVTLVFSALWKMPSGTAVRLIAILLPIANVLVKLSTVFKSLNLIK